MNLRPKMLTMMAISLLMHAAMGQEPAAAPPPPARTVFAHYMTCFHSSVEFYKQEIELAQRHGIDGFALNCGEWMLKPTFLTFFA